MRSRFLIRGRCCPLLPRPRGITELLLPPKFFLVPPIPPRAEPNLLRALTQVVEPAHVLSSDGEFGAPEPLYVDRVEAVLVFAGVEGLLRELVSCVCRDAVWKLVLGRGTTYYFLEVPGEKHGVPGVVVMARDEVPVVVAASVRWRGFTRFDIGVGLRGGHR